MSKANQTSTDAALRAATSAINQALAELEQATGQLVQDISVQRIDVTQLQDPTARYRCTVLIELQRLPAQDWER